MRGTDFIQNYDADPRIQCDTGFRFEPRSISLTNSTRATKLHGSIRGLRQSAGSVGGEILKTVNASPTGPPLRCVGFAPKCRSRRNQGSTDSTAAFVKDNAAVCGSG